MDHAVGGLLDALRPGEHVLQLKDAPFDESLFVLGRFHLGVFDELTALHRFVQPLRHLLASDRPQMLQFLLQLFATLVGQIDYLIPHFNLAPIPTYCKNEPRVVELKKN